MTPSQSPFFIMKSPFATTPSQIYIYIPYLLAYSSKEDLDFIPVVFIESLSLLLSRLRDVSDRGEDPLECFED